MTVTDRYRTPSDLPQQIAVFPLRGVILLPRSLLPLNIFEPRYLAMIEDVISGSRILGVVQPETGEDESPEGKAVPLKRIGCAGRLTAYQELDDGRLLITVAGIARFTIRREVETASPYRLSEVSYEAFARDFCPDPAAEVDRDKLARTLKSYLEARQLRADWKAVGSAPTEPLINSLSVSSPFGPEEKQALLEARDVKARSEILIALAEMELASGESGSGSRLQ